MPVLPTSHHRAHAASILEPSADAPWPAQVAKGADAVRRPVAVAWLAAGLLAAALAGCGGGGGGSAAAAGDGTETGTGTGAGDGTSGGDAGSDTGSDGGVADTGAQGGVGGSETLHALSVQLPSRGAASVTTIAVGPVSDLPADAQRYTQLQAVPWASLPPGTQVLVGPGSYDGPVSIAAQGTAAAPITITASDGSSLPVVSDSLDLNGAAHVTLTGFVVEQPVYSGIVIRNGTHDVTVSFNTVRSAPMGINVTDGAGLGLVLQYNRIEHSTTNGIGVDGVSGTSASRLRITGNQVLYSGHHGMELRGSYIDVDHNVVAYSGQTLGGTSGIHLYSASADENTGDHNRVRYNYSYANVDTTLYDGNGIQVDHWCDDNLVAFNVAWGNDGAGINVYEAQRNRIVANTLAANGRGTNAQRTAFGELIVGATTAIDRTADNEVLDNLLVAIDDRTPALYVDSRAAAHPQAIGANWYWNTASGGPVVRWTDGALLATAAQIDATIGSLGALVEAPRFANAADPLSDGLALTALPSTDGEPLSGLTDLAGTAADDAASWFGAYFGTP